METLGYVNILPANQQIVFKPDISIINARFGLRCWGDVGIFGMCLFCFRGPGLAISPGEV